LGSRGSHLLGLLRGLLPGRCALDSHPLHVLKQFIFVGSTSPVGLGNDFPVGRSGVLGDPHGILRNDQRESKKKISLICFDWLEFDLLYLIVVCQSEALSHRLGEKTTAASCFQCVKQKIIVNLLKYELEHGQRMLAFVR
jgi:hypothetical protein